MIYLGPTLELLRDGRTERVYEVRGADLRIGRTQGNDVHLDDAKVSRHHARIERRADGSCVLVDLQSRWTTGLDGRTLKPFVPALLRDGSRITIVDRELVFRDQAFELREDKNDSSVVLGSLHDLSAGGLAEQTGRPAEVLLAVLEVNRALGGGGDLNEVLGRALEGLMRAFPCAERGFFLTAEPDGTLPVRAVRHSRGPDRPPSLSRTILAHVLREGKAVLIADATVDARFGESGSVMAEGLRTAVCAPLPGHDGKPVGMAQLDSRAGGDRFAAGDLEMLAALAVPVGVAVENHRLLKERASWAAAREIQAILLPRRRPEVPGYTFWECYRPALEVGGDLYDYQAIESDEAGGSRWAVAVGDVSGKGMPAALLMASLCPEVRHLVRAGVGPEEVLSRVSRHVLDSGVDARFVTMALTELDARSHRLTVTNAGHMDPLVRRFGGRVEEVGREGAGPPLGVTPDPVYRSATVALGPGDVVVLYTDGVTDAMDRDGRRFGEDGLHRALAGAPEGVAAVGEAILAASHDHAAGRSQFDDVAVVCFGRDRE